MLRGLRRRLFSQFSSPRGLLGGVAGRLMAKGNLETNRWIVDVLDVAPEDRVLDVGCGPGVAVAACAERATHGRVAGIDRSAVMVRQASKRNAAAVRAGRVEIREAPASRLPFADASFTKAMSVNSLPHWDDVAAGLRELRRVLAPGGVLALGLRRRDPTAGAWDRRAYGMTDEGLASILGALAHAGFGEPKVAERVTGGELHAAVVARR